MIIRIKDHEVLVDAEDYGCLVSDWKFFIIREEKCGKVYFRVYGRPNDRHLGVYPPGKRGLVYAKKTYIHRAILGCYDPSLHIDHVNGDPLDNRKENLRVVTRFQNQANRKKNSNNTSGYKGVTSGKTKHYESWRGQITHDGKTYSKAFLDKHDAARWYNEQVLKYFKGYGVLNDIQDDSESDSGGLRNKRA